LHPPVITIFIGGIVFKKIPVMGGLWHIFSHICSKTLGSPLLLAKTSSPLRWVPMATTLPAAWGFAMQRSEAEFMDLMGFHFTIKRNDVMLTNDDTMINWLVVYLPI